MNAIAAQSDRPRMRPGLPGVRGTAVLLLAAALAAGCGDKGEGPARLSPRGMPYLTGVPVPAGFSLVERNTEDYESGAQRWARHLYRGTASQDSVRNFYREQMPINGWNRVSDQNIKGTISLRFEKASESCTVQISSSLFWSTIHVVVMPLSRSSTEPPPRRPMP
jgi:hypothetical protein